MKTWVWLSIIAFLVAVIGMLLFLLGREVSLSPDVLQDDQNINGCGSKGNKNCYYACSGGNTCVMIESVGGRSNFCDPNRDTCKDKIDVSGGVIGAIKLGLCTLIPGLGIICTP